MKKNELTSFGEWQLVRLLGSGGFGEVQHWKNCRTNQEIATKRLKENDRLSEDEVAKMKQRWQQEYEWMCNLKTSYIVRGASLDDAPFAAYLNEHHVWHPLPVIIMEYCNGGDLRTHLQKIENLNGLDEYEVREVLKTLRYAIEYLHNECRIEHRDLKPDNIVIHQHGRNRCYKLTDFGFARKTSEDTILKSVVGTRHYFAPEVVDTAKYTKTVDYWSLGVITFELLCGILPFIPHQDMYQIIVNIKKKPPQCIAITENLYNANQFEFHSHVFAENRVSKIFQDKIESWMRLALDVNYKTRGTVPKATNGVQRPSDRILKFYTELDDILASKILTVFCLNTYKFYSYEVNSELSFFNLTARMEEDMKIPHDKLFLIFPSGHPHSQLTAETKPADLFVEEWRDTSDSLNPPAMLFVVGYQCEYQLADPYVSAVIKKCLALSSNESVPKWLVQQFEQHTHFVLSNEQRHVEACVSGLKEYALTLEDSIFHFSNLVQLLQAEILMLSGSVKQFSTMAHAAKKAQQNMVSQRKHVAIDTGVNIAKQLTAEIQQIDGEIAQSIQRRYSSVLRRAKEQATMKSLDDLVKLDIYELNTFRTHLKSVLNTPSNVRARMEVCRKALYGCIDKRSSFLSNKLVESSRNSIAKIHKEFSKIKEIVYNARRHLEQFSCRLNLATEDFCANLLEPHKNGMHKQIYPLKLDGTSHEEVNEPNSYVDGIIQMPTHKLVEDAMEHVERMTIDLCMETDSLPTTIEFANS